MNPLPATLAAAFLHWVHEREVHQDDPITVARFGAAYRQLTQFARQADRADQSHLLAALRQGLAPAACNWEFGGIANTCGVIVEHGGDPGLTLEPILDRLSEQLARVPELVRVMQEHLGVEHPHRLTPEDWSKLGTAHPEHAWVIGEWLALRFTGGAAMTMLCRAAGLRQQARRRTTLWQRAEASRSDNPYAYYLAELLGMVDDERLLVLDLTEARGCRVHLTAIRNNFHLFTLLQDALQGPRCRPLVVALAKGERMLSDISPNEWAAGGMDPQHPSDTALWTYCAWQALRASRERKEQMPDWIWGEMKPTEIPIVAGERIMLLGPPEVPRSWGMEFFTPLHADLRSSVKIEHVLSREEHDQWIARIRAAS